MICTSCCMKDAEPGRDECFRCRVQSVGFHFHGGGGYTREAFHSRTISELKTEILGDRKLGEDVVPASDFGW